MPSPTQREERERAEKARKPQAPQPQPKKGNDTTIGGAVDAIKERKKLLDEI